MKRVFCVVFTLSLLVFSNCAFGASINQSKGKDALVVEDAPELYFPGSPIQFYSFGETPVFFGPATSWSDDLGKKAESILATGNTFYNFTGDPQLAVFQLNGPSTGLSNSAGARQVSAVPEPGTNSMFIPAFFMMLALGAYRSGGLKARYSSIN
jgi:hypothetical protein